MSRSFAGWGWGRMYDPKYTFVYGWFMPGKGYENAAGEADDATAWHSVLSYKF